MEQLNTIKELISQGNVEQAILLLDELLQTDFPQKDEAYYLRGNAYRKQSNWQQALNNYRYAIDLNPDSPAITGWIKWPASRCWTAPPGKPITW